MNAILKLAFTFFCFTILFPGHSSGQLTPEKLGWQMGMQAYSFRDVSFLEAVDRTKSLGLNYIEAYPGQKIGGDMTGVMDFKMSDAYQQKILKYLRDKRVKLIAYGVVVAKSPEDWKKLFDFAKSMDIENIVSEPSPADMQMVSDLCDEYKINIAIHNHPKPSHYWNIDSLLAVLNGKSKRIGSCADIGHWAYSGLDVVECLKKLQGRIIEFHFKDVSNKQPEPNEKTAVSGKGIINIKAVIEEMNRQHFKGFVATEYEDDPENNLPEIRESLEYFNQVVSTLAR